MISDWGEVVTRYPYGNVRMDHLLSKEQYFLYSIDNVLHYLCVRSSAGDALALRRSAVRSRLSPPNNGHWKLYSKSDNTI